MCQINMAGGGVCLLARACVCVSARHPHVPAHYLGREGGEKNNGVARTKQTRKCTRGKCVTGDIVSLTAIWVDRLLN